MTSLSTATERGAAEEAERLSRLWWLVLPLVAAVILPLLSVHAPEIYTVYFESEQGLLELSHIAIPAATCWLALRGLAMPEIGGRKWLTAWFALLAAGSLYIAGEEASWGQQIFAWTTPEGWQAINDQNETNLHNISSWLDQKPRLLLELGVIVGGIVVPLLALARPGLRRIPFALLLPPLLCLPSAVLAELFRLHERIGPSIGIGHGAFQRASEVQELYFYLFILFYVIVLRRRIRAEARQPA